MVVDDEDCGDRFYARVSLAVPPATRPERASEGDEYRGNGRPGGSTRQETPTGRSGAQRGDGIAEDSRGDVLDEAGDRGAECRSVCERAATTRPVTSLIQVDAH